MDEDENQSLAAKLSANQCSGKRVFENVPPQWFALENKNDFEHYI